jgi:hypothetical protein
MKHTTRTERSDRIETPLGKFSIEAMGGHQICLAACGPMRPLNINGRAFQALLRFERRAAGWELSSSDISRFARASGLRREKAKKTCDELAANVAEWAEAHPGELTKAARDELGLMRKFSASRWLSEFDDMEETIRAVLPVSAGETPIFRKCLHAVRRARASISAIATPQAA